MLLSHGADIEDFDNNLDSLTTGRAVSPSARFSSTHIHRRPQTTDIMVARLLNRYDLDHQKESYPGARLWAGRNAAVGTRGVRRHSVDTLIADDVDFNEASVQQIQRLRQGC